MLAEHTLIQTGQTIVELIIYVFEHTCLTMISSIILPYLSHVTLLAITAVISSNHNIIRTESNVIQQIH